MRLLDAAMFAILALGFAAVTCAADTPYAGQQTRTIKALSDQELADYLEGHGMGLSKVAELNHYPGPRHVLDQANDLGLSTEQLAKTKSIWKVMDAKARTLGKLIVAQEAVLEGMYSSGEATPENTRAVIDELARVQADLRYTHLSAHLAMRSVLSQEQVAKYDQLRGYSEGADSATDHHRMTH